MAFGSAFGFGFYDPIMSMAEGSVNNYWDKKSESRAFARQLQLMEKQYEYAQRYSENSPTWSVKGLRDAGINPILAVSNGLNTSATAPSVPSTTSHRSPINGRASFSGSGLLPFDRKIQAQTADAQTLSAQAADKQADAALIKANSDRSESFSRIAKLVEEVRSMELSRKGNEKAGNYQHPLTRDIMKMSKEVLDEINAFNNDLSAWITDPYHSYGESYLKSSPHDTKHSKAYEEYLERKSGHTWRTRRSFDSKPVYRKSGDVGGVMHMYR